MLKVVVECDGPGCEERLEQTVPSGRAELCEPFCDDWFVLTDRNKEGETPEARYFCCHRCLTAWTLQHQLEGSPP